LCIFKKIKQPVATANDNFFQKEAHLIWIVQYLFNANHVPVVFEKHNSIETLIYQGFSSSITQNSPFYRPTHQS